MDCGVFVCFDQNQNPSFLAHKTISAYGHKIKLIYLKKIFIPKVKSFLLNFKNSGINSFSGSFLYLWGINGIKVGFTFFMLLIGPQSMGQSYQLEVDSLKEELSKTVEATATIDLLNEISYAYRRMSPDSLLFYGFKANSQARKINYQKGVMVSYKNIGIGYYKLGRAPDSIIYYYEKAIRFAEMEADFYTQTACLNNIGLVYFRNQRYEEALAKFIKGIEMYDTHIKKPLRLRALLIANTGGAYAELEQFPKAKEYIEKALELSRQYNFPSIQSIYMDNYGRILYQMGQQELGKKYLEESILFQKEMGDYLSMVQSLVRYGNILQDEGKTKQAEKSAQHALSITNENGFQEEKTNILVLLSRIKLTLSEYKTAIDFAQQAVNLATEMSDLNFLGISYNALANAYEHNGNYVDALQQRKNYEAIKAQIAAAKISQTVADAEARYKNELQEGRILRLEQEKVDQRKRINLLIGVLVLLGILIATILHFFTKNRKQSRIIAQKNEQLQSFIEKNMQLENFAFIASHDLKTPLRNIVSFTQLLKHSLKNKIADKEKEYFDFIISGTREMSVLINDLLNYAMIQNATPSYVQVELNELIEKVLNRFQTEIKEKQANISFDIQTNTVLTDPTKLSQLLQNLISNAMKFTKPAETPEILISSGENRTNWFISVEDQGIGIEQEYFDRIFLVFKRLHHKMDFEGTGIGLAICRKIVDQLNGSLHLESKVGVGSKFGITFSKEGVGEG